MSFRAGALVVALTTLTTVARAEDPRATADALFEEGKAHYQSNQFLAAIDKFKRAYELARDPVYLFNIAQSYRNAADCANAFEYYSRFLAEDPATPNADAVRAWLRELEPCAKRITELTKQAQSPGAPAAPAASIAVGPGEQLVDRGRGLRIAGLALAGVGIAGVAAGVVYGVKAQGYENEIAAACRIECQWDDLAARDRAGERANTLSLVGYVAGGVVLGAGVGLYILGTTKVERITVTPTAGGGQVGAQLSF